MRSHKWQSRSVEDPSFQRFVATASRCRPSLGRVHLRQMEQRLASLQSMISNCQSSSVACGFLDNKVQLHLCLRWTQGAVHDGHAGPVRTGERNRTLFYQRRRVALQFACRDSRKIVENSKETAPCYPKTVFNGKVKRYGVSRVNGYGLDAASRWLPPLDIRDDPSLDET